MCSGGGAPSPRNTFFASWRRAHLPFGTLFLRPGGRPVPSAPLNSPSRPYPAPLNTLAPPPPAPQNPRLFRPRPAPGPTAERAGPAPAPPQNPLHRPRPAPLNTLALSRLGPRKPPPKGRNTPPESPFRGHLSKSRPRSWVFRGIFRTFECKKCLLQPIT